MVGTLLSGGSLILRGVAGTLRPGSARLRPSGSFLASSGAEPVSGRPRLGGGGGSKGLGLLEVKEWARGKSEKAGFRGTGTGGGGYAGGCVRVSAELKKKSWHHIEAGPPPPSTTTGSRSQSYLHPSWPYLQLASRN